MDTGKVAAVGHGGVTVIAWLSDNTATGRGQAGSLQQFFRLFVSGQIVRLYHEAPWSEAVARLREIWTLPA